MRLPKSLVERLCEFKIYAISVLSFIGSVCAPDNYLRLAPSVDLVLIWLAFIPSVWRLAIGLQRAHSHFAEVLKKSVAGHNCTPLFALSPAWVREFLFPSMARSTADAFDIVSRLGRNDTLDDVPQNKKNRKLPLGFFMTNSMN